jgi:hypothetical protein
MVFALPVLIGKCKHRLAPCFAGVPLDNVREHAQEDVGALASLQMTVDGMGMQCDLGGDLFLKPAGGWARFWECCFSVESPICSDASGSIYLVRENSQLIWP